VDTSQPQPASVSETIEGSTCAIPDRSEFRLPIVRLLPKRTGRPRLLAIYDDHLLIGICRRKFSISESMFALDGEAALTAGLKRVRRISFSDVRKLALHQGVAAHYYTLTMRQGRSLHFSLSKFQAGHVTQLLYEKLADQTPFRRLWTSRLMGALVTLIGTGAGLAALHVVDLNQGTWNPLLALAALAMTVAGLWLMFTPGAPWKQPTASVTGPQHPARHAVLVAKPPLRSKTLGWTLKFVGLAYWFVLYSPLTDPFRDWLNSQTDSGAQGYVWTILWFPAPLLIFTGYRLCQRRYVPKQGGDSRQPILFLRPFQDDEHTSLQPSGLTAQATGIRSRSALIRDGKTDTFDLLWSAHPMRVMRMIADYGAGSSEESIARYFEKHGPVIAIGKPGEHLASPGAARMYLNDATWQDAILTELERAQAVVIQPAPSEGVHWELSTVREKVAPTRVLLCLISYWNNPEYYEELCSVVAETLHVDLPRSIPYLKRPAFVYFDEQWNPHVQELSYKNPMLWPVTQDGADLHYSLAPFISGMQGSGHQPARPPRWIGGPSSWVASIAAIALGIILLVVPHLLVAFSGEMIKLATGGKLSASHGASSLRDVTNSAKITLHGIAVPYQIQLPQSMVTVKPPNAQTEYWRTNSDDTLQIQIIADKQTEDLSTFQQQRLQAYKQEEATAHVDSQRTFVQNGISWMETRLNVTLKAGIQIREIDRATAGPQGTVLIITQIVGSSDSDSAYMAIADDAFQSFHFDAPATP